jgi:hypothetical protein
MGAHDGSINHHVFVIGIARQRPEKSIENAAPCPSTKALVHDFPMAKTRGFFSDRLEREATAKSALGAPAILSAGLLADAARASQSAVRKEGGGRYA